MKRSAVVLSRGFSTKFGQDKATLKLNGKQRLKHVYDSVTDIVDEVIVVTSTRERQETYASFLELDVGLCIDKSKDGGRLIGALTGFEIAQRKYCLLLASDMPLYHLM